MHERKSFPGSSLAVVVCCSMIRRYIYVCMCNCIEGYGTFGCQVRVLCHGLLTQWGNRDLICKWITTRRHVFVLFFYYRTRFKGAWKFHIFVKAEVCKLRQYVMASITSNSMTFCINGNVIQNQGQSISLVKIERYVQICSVINHTLARIFFQPKTLTSVWHKINIT